MKKLFTIFGSIFLLQHSSDAQITLTSAIAYTQGKSYSIQACSVSGTMPSAAGANVSVDYSSFTANGSPQSQTFVDPTTTTYTSQFPTATVASPANSTQGNTGFSYYKTSANKVELIGIATNAYIMTYSNPSTIMSFPMTFNDNTTDTFKASYTVNGIDIVRTGAVTMLADAYGTIKTPAGTSSYLRLKITQQIIDSFSMAGSLMQISTSQITTYNYMNNGSGVPLFSYSEIITGQGSSVSAYYNTSIPTALSETKPSAVLSAEVFPNPVKDIVTLKVNMLSAENMVARVVDITGREAMTAHSFSAVTGENELRFPVSSLSPGIYSVVLQSDSKGNTALKFMVE